MSTCPFCQEALPDEQAEECPTCGQDLHPPELHPYDAALETLDDALGRIAAGEIAPALIPTLFSHLLGSVQQVLDHCREDLAANLRNLQTSHLDLPEEARTDALEFIARFETAQDKVNEHMDILREIFASSSTMADFEAQRPQLDHAMAQLRATFGDLEDLERTTSDPLLTVVADEPLPEEVSVAIAQFELAMNALGRYCDERDRGWLQKSLLHLDEARGRLKQMLMVDAFDWA